MDRESQQSMIDNIQEENPSVSRLLGYIPNPDDPHEFGECIEDWHEYEWRKEQKEMDCRRKEEEWKRWSDVTEELP